MNERSENVALPTDERVIWPRGALAAQIDQLRMKWPQAWVSRERNSNGQRLVAIPGFELTGWSHSICTALWLARVTEDDDHVNGPLRGFWVDIPDLRLANHFHPKNTRGTHDLHYGGRSEPRIPGFTNWVDLTQFWWKQQMWDLRDTLFTHALVIRTRLRMAV